MVCVRYEVRPGVSCPTAFEAHEAAAEGRPTVEADDELGWARQTYRIAYKVRSHTLSLTHAQLAPPSLTLLWLAQEPFYKGGKVKARVPGWCDRVVCHSMPAARETVFAEPVQLKATSDDVIVVRVRWCRVLVARWWSPTAGCTHWLPGPPLSISQRGSSHGHQ